MLLRGRNLRARFSRIGLGDVNMTIGGDIDLRKAPGAAPQLVGSVTVVRGFYDFQGRRFEIERDSLIRFEGIEPLNPTLQIVAKREISGVLTQVNLRGTVRSPELTLSSQPPLDEADILSLIVFNQPVNALGQNERVGLVERAGELAAGYVTAPLADSIADALDLDLFEIRTVGESGVGTLAVGWPAVRQSTLRELSTGVWRHRCEPAVFRISIDRASQNGHVDCPGDPQNAQESAHRNRRRGSDPGD